jgi:putative phosphoribosyl transferase
MNVAFRDRQDAGKQLGEKLKLLEEQRPILLGLARGGVPVAAAAAEVLGSDLDVLVVRKVAPPGNREYGIGAVAPEGIVYFDPEGLRATGLSPEALEETIEEERAEMQRRIEAYRGGTPAPDVQGRLVVLVDDGLATGVTAIAAIRYVRTLRPAKVVFAVPVLSEPALEAVEREADEVVYVTLPYRFRAVGEFYEDFSETKDADVCSALASARSGDRAD